MIRSWRIRLASALSLFALAAAAPPGETSAAEPKRVAIVADRTDGTIRFQALAIVAPRDSGRYAFVVEKAGRSGSSTIRQGGAVAPSGPREASVVLTTSTVSAGADDSVTASLTVFLDNGTVHVDRWSQATP